MLIKLQYLICFTGSAFSPISQDLVPLQSRELWRIKPCVHRACQILLVSLKVCTKACLDWLHQWYVISQPSQGQITQLCWSWEVAEDYSLYPENKWNLMSWESVVWGKEVPARWRWLQPGPEGVREICQRQLPFLYLGKEKGSSEQSHIPPAFGCHQFSFHCVFSTCLKSGISHPAEIYPVWNANLEMEGEPCHGGSMTATKHWGVNACFSLKLGKEERMGPGKQEHNGI